MSADFKKMMELLRQQRPELNHDSIRDMIDEKKRKIGAGYLTDQGALFLVAADLGVSFENVPKLSAEIKDLYIGAKDITLTARILNVYPIRKFLKKDSNVEIRNRTLTVYDQFSCRRSRFSAQPVARGRRDGARRRAAIDHGRAARAARG